MNNRILTSCMLVSASLVLAAGGCMAQDGVEVDQATSRFDPVEGDARRPDFTLTDMQGQSRTMDEWNGISCRHGTHQLAQKSTSTILPSHTSIVRGSRRPILP